MENAVRVRPLTALDFSHTQTSPMGAVHARGDVESPKDNTGAVAVKAGGVTHTKCTRITPRTGAASVASPSSSEDGHGTTSQTRSSMAIHAL